MTDDPPIDCAEGVTLNAQELELIKAHAHRAGAVRVEVTLDGKDAAGFPCLGLHLHMGPVKFNRIRRVTGYLAGDVSRFNDAKRAEVRDRLRHSIKGAVNE